MVTRTRRLAVAVSGATLAFIFCFASAAYAGQSIGAYGYYSVNGINYRNYAVINTNPSYYHQAYGVTLVSPRNKPAPGGWMGALPQTYRNGSLYCTATYSYNPELVGINQVLNPSGCFKNEVNVWAARGATKAWNGSSYNAYWVFLTPSQNS